MTETSERPDAPATAAPKLKAHQKPLGYLAPRDVPLVYLNMPKSGCTTIKNLLHRLDSGRFLDDPLTIHSRQDLLVRPTSEPHEIMRRLRTDFVFTFVRHPLRRAYSCFNEKVYFETAYSFPQVRAFLITNYGAEFDGEPTLERHRANFKAFLRFSTDSFHERNGWRRDPHWCPQTMVLTNVARWGQPDFVGKVERLGEHLSLVLRFAGIEETIEIPRMNEGPPPPFGYSEVRDAETDALGRSLFAQDFRRFRYDL